MTSEVSHRRHPRSGRVRKRYVALFAMLAFVGWVGWKAFVIMSARPGPLVDYTKQLTALSETHQPAGKNGWPALSTALEHFDKVGAPEVEGWPTDEQVANEIMMMDAVAKGPFDRERFKFELAYLAHLKSSGVFEELDAALAAPRFARMEYPEAEIGLIFRSFPELYRARRLAKLLRAEMRVAAEEDDVEGFVRASLRLVGLARATSFESMLVGGLDGMAILEMDLDELGIAVGEHPPDATTCRGLLDSLNSDSILSPIAYTWECERLLSYDTIQRTFTDDGHGNGILLVRTFEEYFSNYVPSGAEQPVQYNLLGLLYATRAETTQVIDEYYGAAIEQSGMSRSERRAQPIDLETYEDTLPQRQVVTPMLIGATGGVNRLRDVTNAKLAATRILLAIELFRSLHQRPPQSLDELAPECLTSIPIDPVSEKAFVFRVREPSEGDPRTYWLYSIGLDGVDNQGVEAGPSAGDSIDAMRDPRDGKGFDYVFNRLRDAVEQEW